MSVFRVSGADVEKQLFKMVYKVSAIVLDEKAMLGGSESAT